MEESFRTARCPTEKNALHMLATGSVYFFVSCNIMSCLTNGQFIESDPQEMIYWSSFGLLLIPCVYLLLIHSSAAIPRLMILCRSSDTAQLVFVQSNLSWSVTEPHFFLTDLKLIHHWWSFEPLLWIYSIANDCWSRDDSLQTICLYLKWFPTDSLLNYNRVPANHQLWICCGSFVNPEQFCRSSTDP